MFFAANACFPSMAVASLLLQRTSFPKHRNPSKVVSRLAQTPSISPPEVRPRSHYQRHPTSGLCCDEANWLKICSNV
eukprot:COSAG02_NODE_45602_length_355_cov_1.644531_1_plen_76_part_10